MKRSIGSLVLLMSVGLMPQMSTAQKPATSPVLQALEEEMKRAMTVLGKQGTPAPYFMGYEVNETATVDIQASQGALQSSEHDRIRVLDVEVRVGDYDLDNTHQIRGGNGGGGGGSTRPASVLMPIDDDVDALKSVIWLATDRQYKTGVSRLTSVKANRAVNVAEEDTSADLSRETAQKAMYPDILEGDSNFTSNATNQYVVNTEGTSVRSGTIQYRLMLYATTRAADGMELYRFEAFDAHSVDGMPKDSEVRAMVDKMAKDLKALRNAPIVEPFTGPAILSGRAAGVFFHEIFGHRIEGQRQKNENEGQTFAKQVGKPVLPEFISVIDDPTTEKIVGTDLNGYYLYDDEGVKSRPVNVVENGILRNFLLSRSPVAGFESSNGHGRKAPGYQAVGRQGNLIVKASTTVSNAKLKEMLIAEAKKQGKQFGLFFEDISGGFTLTTRDSPQAFQVTPIMVYKVYVDGKPDELVRGVDLIGTPLTSFSKIVAASDKLEVFNGFCGAESGYVPVSAVAPSILTTQIEVQKKAKSSERMPILPAPTGGI
jgi:predicted Zn-dependent protease